jgi:hypothetical protein
MPPRLKKIKAIFYETAGGSKPVRTFLLGLPEEDRRIVGTDIATVETASPLGCQFAGR